MSRLFITLLILPVSIFSKPNYILSDGYFVNSFGFDSVQVQSTDEQISILTMNGERIHFNIIGDGNYRHQKFPGDDYYDIKIEGPEKFTIFDSQNSQIAIFNLYKMQSFFNNLIAILVGSALFISIFQAYLKVNKIWKRRKISEVANSISIVASLMGFAVLVPFLMNSLFITNDYPAAGKSMIGLILAGLFSLISIGYFVEDNRGKGLVYLLINALYAEKGESTDLISAMLRPHGAKKIIEILIKLAAIDDEVAQEEIDLIKEFADKWHIDIPDLQAGKPENVTNLIELKELVQSYLDEKPDVEVAQGLTDLINLMAEADDEVTDEEAMAVAEFSGMIAHYVNAEKGGLIDMFEVNIVPQGDKQMRAINELLPDTKPVKDRGGEVFKVGKFFSEEYADAICEKYIALGLYSDSVRVKPKLDQG